MHFEELLALLKRFGYRGGYVIEVYRKSFSQLSELRASYHHMKNILTSAL